MLTRLHFNSGINEWQLKTPNIQFPKRTGPLNSKANHLLLTVIQGQSHAVRWVKRVAIPNISFLSPNPTW